MVAAWRMRHARMNASQHVLEASSSMLRPSSPVSSTSQLQSQAHPVWALEGTDIVTTLNPIRQATPTFLCTKAAGFEIRLRSEHQNYNLENEHITTATLIKFTQKIVC